MTQRSPVVTGLLALIVPFYSLWWLVSTKREMNAKYGTKVVTAWVILIPFMIGPLWLLWSYGTGANKVTGKFSPIVGMLVFFVPFLGFYLHQTAFNELAQRGGAGTAMRAA